jgi:hypothetical protein
LEEIIQKMIQGRTAYSETLLCLAILWMSPREWGLAIALWELKMWLFLLKMYTTTAC